MSQLKTTFEISIELTEEEAQHLAELLRRLEIHHVRSCARNDEEAHEMLFAAEHVRTALARNGYRGR